MSRNAKYQEFKDQAKKNRADANKKIKSTEAKKPLSDEAAREILEKVGFDLSGEDAKMATLQDGTKCFVDSYGKCGVLTDKGIFSTRSLDGESVRYDKSNNGEYKFSGWIGRDEAPQYSDEIVKLRDGAVALKADAGVVIDLKDLANAATLPKRMEEAEKSSVVQQAKSEAKSLGFDEKTLQIKILDDDVGLIAQDGFAIGKGDTFYFVPNAETLSNDCVLKEMKFSNDGAAPTVKDIPLNEDTAKLVDEVYAKLNFEFYDVSESYGNKIRDFHLCAENMWQEKEQKIKDSVEYAENVQVLGSQFQEKVAEGEENQIYRVGHFGNNMADTYSKYAVLADAGASPEERKEALDSLTEAKEFLKNAVSRNDSSSLKVELKNVHQKECENFETKKKELSDASMNEGNGNQDNRNTSSLAFYSLEDGTITMKQLSEDAREELRTELKQQAAEGDGFAILRMKNGDTLYELKDTMAQLSTLYHENNHKNDFDNSGGMEMRATPKNNAKVNRLTETKSCAVEYLAVAHQYTEMKKQGVKTVEINGEKKPLEYMLDMHTGLREVVDKHGFDVNNPESVRRVVEASSVYWHNNRMEGYNSQASEAIDFGLYYLNSNPMSKQLKLLKEEDKKYQQVSETMLKNTYIGQNTVVDLSHCRDLLDTMTDDDARKIGNGAYIVSYDELKNVSDYLDKKGLKKDSDKMAYLAQHMKDLGYRKEDKDPELTKILLAEKNTILCADGLEYSRAADGSVTCYKDGKAYVLEDITTKKEQQPDFSKLTAQQTR